MNFTVLGSNDTNEDINIVTYLRPVGFKKNSYCDFTVYNNDEEIIGSFHPKHGRTFIWNDSMPVILRPPSINYMDVYVLKIKVTQNKEKHEKAVIDSKV